MKRHKAFKFELNPTKSQKDLLNQTFGVNRQFWNHLVYSFNKGSTELTSTQFRKESNHTYRLNVSAVSIQQVERNFDEFKKQYFNKKRKVQLGRPRFKRKSSNQSFRLTNQTSKLRGNRLHISRIGLVKINQHIEIPETSRHLSTTISVDTTGKYYASLLYEVEINHLPKTNKVIALDLGVKVFATLSNGQVVENFKHLDKGLKEIKRLQKILSRKTIGSNKYNKCKIKLAKAHKKISNRRNHFQHVLSHHLINNYDVICLEDLSVKELLMKSNKHMSRNISDVSWSSFISKLKYKADWYGKYIYQVNRYYPSTKTCSSCENVKEMPLDVRTYECDNCDLVMDRDLNASHNIINVFRNNEYSSRRSSYDLTDIEETDNSGKRSFPELSFEVGVELVKFKTNGEPNIMFGS